MTRTAAPTVRARARTPADHAPRWVVEAMEPRLLHSADPLSAATGLDAGAVAVATEQRLVALASHTTASTTASATANPQSTPARELVLIDTSIDDGATLLAGLQAQRDAGRPIDIVAFGAADDGLARLGEALAGRHDLSAVHVISHGSDGVLQLGSARLDAATLLQRAGEVAAWGEALGADADLLLYGCDLAASDAGRALLQNLAQLTGADVAASTDPTGAATRGGDWVLEAATGPIETPLAPDADALAAYRGLLGSDIAVNTTGANDQTTSALNRGSQQAVAVDGSGNFVVVWTSRSQDGDGLGVYARRFAADGSALTGEIRVNTTTTGDQHEARVVSDSAGNFAVVWTSNGQDGSGTGVYWRRFNAAGSALTGEVRANATTTGAQQNPVIALNPTNGNLVVAWQGQSAADLSGISFRRFAADGSAIDQSDLRADSLDTGAEQNPAIAMDASGNFVIAWDVNNHVYFQRFEPGSGMVGARTQVDAAGATSEGAAIAMDAAGNFAVVHRQTGADSGVWVSGFHADGSVCFTSFQAAGGDADSASVAMAADGQFVVTWQASGDGSGQGILARRFAADGSPRDAAFQVNTTTVGDQVAPSVAAKNAGRFVLAWSGKDAADSKGVLAQVVTLGVAPVIGSDGGGASAALQRAENTTAVTTVTASDADTPAQTLTYSIAGGADAALFAINTATGALRFQAAPDFEAPADAGADNVYDVIVSVSDGVFDTRQALAVTVTDVGGPLTVSTTADLVDGNTGSVEALIANPGADGRISLREAISAANNTAGADAIVLPAGTYTLTIAGSGEDLNADGDLDILGDLVITGAGSTSTQISGNDQMAVFEIVSGSASLSGLTVRNGLTLASGAGIEVNSGAQLSLTQVVVRNNASLFGGGGIVNGGRLSLTDVEIRNNQSSAAGGGLASTGSSLTLNRVTLADNSANNGGGAYLAGSGALTLTNVTVSGNVANTAGGGLYLDAPAQLLNVTIADNRADTASGGGVYLDNTAPAVSLRNVLLSANTGGNIKLLAGGLSSLGNNLSSDLSLELNQASDKVLTAAQLGALADNGGFTRTRALLGTSPAINAGSSAAAPATDQRGNLRNGAADIGAFEYNGPSNLAPTNTLPSSVTVHEDVAATLTGLSVNDPNLNDGLAAWQLAKTALSVGHGSLQVTLAGSATIGSGANGSASLTISGSQADINATLATLRYQATADYNGADTLVVSSSDASNLVDTDNLAITVSAVNDAPSGTNASLVLDATGRRVLRRADFGFRDASGDTDTLAAVRVQLPSAGSLRLAGTVLTATTEVTLAQLDADALVYQAGAGASGAGYATLRFQVRDNGGTSNGGVDLDPSANTLTLDATAPIARDDTATTVNGATTTIDVLANDSSATGGTLRVLDVGQAAHGSAIVTTGGVQYTPTPGYAGSDSFSYRIIDGTEGLLHYWPLDGQVADTVGSGAATAFNGPTPVSGPDGTALQFDGVNDFVALQDFAYTNSFTLQFWFRMADNNGSGYRYLYAHDDAATLNSLNVYFIEKDTDTQSGTKNVLRTRLRDGNDGDDLNGLDVSASGLTNNQWHLYTLTTQTSVGSKVYIDGTLRATSGNGGDAINPSGNITLGVNNDVDRARLYTGALDSAAFFGRTLDAGQVAAQYAGAWSEATVTVNVGAANRAPVITSHGGEAGVALQRDENTTEVTVVTATDADGSTPTLSLTGDDAALFRIDAGSGRLSFIAAPDFEAPADADHDNVYQVTVRASDGALADTQAFSVRVADLGGPITVTTAADVADVDLDTITVEGLAANQGADGKVSLREALVAANRSAGADEIRFDITGTDVQVLSLASTLPDITDRVTIDGLTQATATGTPLIELRGDGAGEGNSGFTLVGGSDGSVIRGLAINGFKRSAIVVVGGSGNHVITGNYLGTDASGQVARPNAFWGIDLNGAGSGIRIGGSAAGEGNVVAANRYGGIAVNGAAATTLQGNLVGVAADGVTALGNELGVLVFGSTSNVLIGGNGAGQGNLIAHSRGDGVAVGTAGSNAAILGNRIFDNGALGIDLGWDGNVLPNDVGDADSGPNALQNFPVIGLAETTGSQLHLTGTIDSSANTDLRLEFFASPAAHASGHGEGQVLIGRADLRTAGSGRQGFDLVFNTSVPAGWVVTATATRAEAGFTRFTQTSEFSAAIVATAPNTAPQITQPGNGAATATLDIAENSLTVATITATDAQNQALQWSLDGGTDAARFGIGGGNGQLSFLRAPDREAPDDANADGVYEVVVKVTDSAGASDRLALQVRLSDLNDTAPVVSASPVLHVAEHAAAGTAMATLAASDDDLAGSLSGWAIVSGNTDGAFVLDAATGQLRVANPAALSLTANASFSLGVTVFDGQQTSAVRQIAVAVDNVNDAPTAGVALADQSATEDQSFAFTVPASAFTDVDAGDSLSFSARQAGGAALPAWLQFDAATRRFSGTPANADVGTLTLRVTATDAAGASVWDDFVLTVANANDAPTLANPLADQAATEDQAFAFTVPASTFADVDAGDTLSFSARQASGAALPAWLQFDAATRRFSGTPANADVGTLTLRVTATDAAGASVWDDFVLTVANANDAPTLANPLADQAATEDQAFIFTVPASTFADVDAGDTLSFSARQASGATLPAWLQFDAATRRFSGTPTNADVGTLTLRVTATDAAGAAVSGDFVLRVANSNDAPTLANPLADQAAVEGQAFGFTVPAGRFADVDLGDRLQLSATLADGSALPAWLRFDAASGRFSGTPGAADVGTLALRLQAVDDAGASAEAGFRIAVAGINHAPAGQDGQLSLTEDTAYALRAADFGFSDPLEATPHGLAAVRIATLPASGSLTLAGTALRAGQEATRADIDAGHLVYTPAANANGSGLATLDFQVRDDGGTALGGSDLDPTLRRLRIDVAAVNDAPVLVSNTLVLQSSLMATPQIVVADVDTPPASIVLSVDAVSGGRFVSVVDGRTLQQFTVADTLAGLVRFEATGTSVPSYQLQVSDGAARLAPSAAVVSLLEVPTAATVTPAAADPLPANTAAATPATSADTAAKAAATPAARPAPAAPAAATGDGTAEPAATLGEALSPVASATRGNAGLTIATAFSLPQFVGANVAPNLDIPALRNEADTATAAPQDLALLARVAAPATESPMEAMRMALRSDDMREHLAQLHRRLDAAEEARQVMVSSGTAASLSLSVGYVIWLVRGGALIGSMLSALPAWQMLDPLPVLARSGTGGDDSDGPQEDVDRLFDDDDAANAAPPPRTAAEPAAQADPSAQEKPQ